MNDTADFLLDEQAVRITTQTNNTAATLDSANLSAVDLTGKQVRLLVKVEGLANLADLRFYCSDNSFTNFFNFNLGLTETRPNATFLKEGEWRWITLQWSHASSTGSPTRNSLTKFRLRAQATNGTAATVHLNAVQFVPESGAYLNGVASICFDDGRASPFTLAKPKLDSLGWAATAYPIKDRTGLATYLTVAQLRQLRDFSGWEIGCHAATQTNHDAGFDTLTGAAVATELQASREWLHANNLGAGEGFAWPLGTSTKSQEDAAARLYAYGRGNTSTSRETFPPANRMCIRSVAVSASTSTSVLNGYVDRAKTDKAWLCLTFHDIVASGASGGLEYNQADFNTVMDYIAGQGLMVLPVIDVLRATR